MLSNQRKRHNETVSDLKVITRTHTLLSYYPFIDKMTPAGN